MILKSGNLQIRTVALIDTGAQISCVRPRMAQKLELKRIDEVRISGVAAQNDRSEGKTDVCLAFVGVEGLGDVSIPCQLIVANFAAARDEISLLIGRPFLAHFDLNYEGVAGRFSLEYTPANDLPED
ncbi:MAG: retropepsin-like aspartic protease [Pseudomonadota bacterium]